MEREFTDYDDWMAAGGDPTYGQGVSPIDPYTPPTTAPAPTGGPPYTAANPPPAGSAPPGTNWMLNPQTGQFEPVPIGSVPPWGAISSQPGTPPPTASPTPPPAYEPNYGGDGDYFGGDGGDFGGLSNPNANFQWPTYSAAEASFPNFQGFKSFQQPSMESILGDPVLQAQLTEGNRRIKGDRAFRGILRTGDTLKDIFDWTSDRIKLGAHDAFDRAFKVYDVNERQNPFNTWSANRDLYFQNFDRNASGNRDEFLFNQYEPAKMSFEDNYRKWAKTGDWLNTPVTVPD